MNQRPKSENLKANDKHARRMEIAAKYQMTKNIRSYMFFMLVLFVMGALLSWWSFSGWEDRWLANISANSKMIIGWVAAFTAVISFLLSAFLFYIWGNAKKHVLKLIEIYDKRYPNAKYQWEKTKKK